MQWDADDLRKACGGTWLRPCDAPVRVTGVGIDTRSFNTGDAYVAIRGELHDGHAFIASAVAAGASVLVVDDASAVDDTMHTPVIFVNDTRAALLDMARACRERLTRTRVIGVTGSAGKTTTCRMIDAALGSRLKGRASKKSFNNEIGVPLTLLGAETDDDYLICEIGTNAPGEIDMLASVVRPDIAVITSIGRAHLEGLGSVEGVAREKSSLLTHVRAGGFAVVTADTDLLDTGHPDTVRFGRHERADVRVVRSWYDDRGCITFETGDGIMWSTGLVGEHNACNAAAAIAIGRRLGIEDPFIHASIMQMQTAPMRLDAKDIGAVRVLDDAYNANPESMIEAITTLSRAGEDASRRVVVLGDMHELGEAGPSVHAEIGDHLVKAGDINAAVLIGPLMRHAADRLTQSWDAARVTHLPDLKENRLHDAASAIKDGDCVLIKGSRVMGLERVVDELRRRADTDGPMAEAAGTLSADG